MSFRVRFKKSKTILTAPKLVEIINQRLIIVILVMSLVFGFIFYRLYDITILNQAYYANKLELYTRTVQTITTPRGNIVDRNGEVLVTNRLVLNIVYFPKLGITTEEEWEIALKFPEYFDMDETTMNLADKRDLFIFLYIAEAKALMSEAETLAYKNDEITDGEWHALMSSKLTDEHLTRLTTSEKKAYLVYQAMKTISSGRPKLIKSDVSQQEVAFLLEHSQLFPGFYHSTDWERVYPQGDLLRSVLGSVTTAKQGLPSENLEYYLALDYARNEKVGRSGLELKYEELLSGEGLIQNITYNDEGSLNIEVLKEGFKGNDLRISIDSQLQKKVESIAISYLERNKNNVYRKYFDNVQLVVMNPNNGDVLSLVGMNKDTDGTYYNDGSQTYYNVYEIGSAIKGSVVYMGLSENLIKPNEVISDAPIKVAGAQPKSSYNVLSNIYDIRSLSESSNVFMFHIAMRLAGIKYYPGVGIGSISEKEFATLRNYFSMFGLGVQTGIDILNEASGFKGSNPSPGNLLDFAIGQYDTYSAIQLAQYVSTIANGGKKVRPRLLVTATEADSDIVVYRNETEILSTLTNSEAITRVQKGFRECVVSGLCYTMRYLNVPVAAKTGTADTFINIAGKYYESNNNTIVAYAPYSKPEIAVSCIVPNSWNDINQGNICGEIARDVIAYYFSR